MKRIILFCLVMIPFLSMGQAIRLNVYGKSYMMKDAPNNRYVGLGYEQNLSTKISLTLEYNIDFGGTTSFSDDFTYVESGNHYSVYYYYNSSFMMVNYQAKYFFRENDVRSTYMSAGISWQGFKMESSATKGDQISGTVVDRCNYSGTKALFPLSWRLGYRGPIDGVYLDFSTGLTFTPGASGFDCDFVDDHSEVSVFNNFCFNFNIAIGYGWAHE